MNYITATDLLEHLGKSELRMTIIGKLDADIDADLLALVVTGGDVSAYQAEPIAEANRALNLIESAIEASTNLMNGYIPQRHSLPLDAAVIASSPLPGICRKLVRYELALTASEQVGNDKKDALQQLRDISKGMIVLGSEDPLNTTSSAVRVCRSNNRNLTTGFGR